MSEGTCGVSYGIVEALLFMKHDVVMHIRNAHANSLSNFLFNSIRRNYAHKDKEKNNN